MTVNPELFKLRLDAVLVPIPEQSHEDRIKLAKRVLSESLALSVVEMDRFIEQGPNAHGDEVVSLELFVFTREEMNMFMESVADATVKYLAGGSKQN